MLTPDTLKAILASDVLVEEKVDGANVMLWRTTDGIQAATRGGPGGLDRAGQLGPLKAWVAANLDALDALLVDRRVLYGEWLWVEHAIHYDRLEDYLVCLDLSDAPEQWLDVDARRSVVCAAGLRMPPEVWRGTLNTVDRLGLLLGDSHLSSGPAEGLIVRSMNRGDGVPRIAKFVRRDFVPRDDARWRGKNARNALQL